MAKESRAPDTNKQSGGVTIGDVIGGIRNSIIAGRDVIFPGSTAEQRAQRNRRAMLELVRNTWIKGVLEQSLHGAAMIELGLENRADAVEHPWDMMLQTPDWPNRALPGGTKIADVFDDMNRALLILGEPGSGKTTMLLELARDTIAHAEQDLTQPIPVVFNLSSWAEKRQSITEWLVDELNAKYHIPKKTARSWVENDDLLLLLDGLDEVKREHREACVEAINDFRQERGLTPMALCSRVADYEALTTRLKLQGAILLQPFTPEQVDKYLEGAGIELLAVRKTLQYDPTLREVAESPLMLSIMTLAYKGMSAREMGSFDAVETRRKHVFDAYVRRMLKRRGADQRYSPGQAVQWLVWLAQGMTRHMQSMFLIERMQPSWLQSDTQQRLYNAVPFLTCGLLSGLFFVPLFAGSLAIRLIVGLTVGLIIGLTGVVLDYLTSSVISSVIAPANVEPVEVLRWSREGGEAGLIIGAYFGLMVGLFLGLMGLANDSLLGLSGLVAGIVSMLLIVLAVTSVFALAFMLVLGVNHARIETRLMPNQGIRQSAENAVTIGLVSGLILGLPLELLFRSMGEPLVGLTWGAVWGLVLGLWRGGLAAIRHLTIRLVLYCNGCIPWNYARFLDYVAERIFLRKVGGGYIFVHRLLMEHFAAMSAEEAA